MQNTNDKTTYEDYLKAKEFARWKYKYGIFVLIGSWICLILLCYFVWHYAEELSTHPAIYAVEKLGVNECYCTGDTTDYYINSTTIMIQDKFLLP
jgi:hypothetical protein